MSEEDKKDDNVRPLLRSVLAGSELAAKLTNEEFLNVVYRNADRIDQRWTLSMTYARAGWAGEMEGPAPDNPLNDNFLSVATFKPGSISRSKESFAAAHLVVLDDADPFQVYALSMPPSYVLETSPGNYQFGYLLTAPVTDRAAYSELMVALGRKKFVKQDSSGNNAIRVVRLPVGSNTKPEHKSDGGVSPRCRLLQWDPTRHYDFAKLAKVLAPTEQAAEASPEGKGEVAEEAVDEGVGMSDVEFSGLLENIRNGLDYHDSINRSAARLVARGTNPVDAKTLLRHLMQATSAAARDDRWLQRYSDIGRAVDTAFKKFGPKVEAEQEGPQASFSPLTIEETSIARLHPRVILTNLLYADVRTRIAAGGVGKTTLALFEAITLALGRALWGRLPDRPIRTVIVTREDTREILAARAREIMRAMDLSDEEKLQVVQNLVIVDLSSVSYRISKIVGDVVQPDTGAISWLVENLDSFKPDWLIMDPMVSFGVGEQRVNDAEQGLIEAMRMVRGRFDCCVEGIHHSGKGNARDKTLDQYSGRGGSAMADGSRMVCVMQPLDNAEFEQLTGRTLEENESAIVMALPKMSYAPKQEPIYVLRKGYTFTQIAGLARLNENEIEDRNDDMVFDVIKDAVERDQPLTNQELREGFVALFQRRLKRQEVIDAVTRLKRDGRVVARGKEGGGKGGPGNRVELFPIVMEGGSEFAI